MRTHVREIGGPAMFEDIRAGRQRFVVIDRESALSMTVGDRIYLRYLEQSSSAVVTTVASYDWGGVVGIDRVWTHGDGEPEEELLSKIEEACAQVRQLSHPPHEREEQRSLTQDIHNRSRMLHLYFGGYSERK